jgi:ribonuclease P protein component
MFPKNRRIAKAKEWQIIHRRGQVIHGRDIVIKILKNNLPITRFGIVVGTKVSKKAVRRNAIRRKISAVISQKMAKVREGNDIVLITKPSIVSKKAKDIESIVTEIFEQANLL